jgi:hypothetical protein
MERHRPFFSTLAIKGPDLREMRSGPLPSFPVRLVPRALGRITTRAGLAIPRQSFAQGRQIAYAEALASGLAAMPPLRLTDSQLAAIWAAAAPLAPRDRDPFVRAVGQALQECRDPGDGDVARAIRAVQRRHFDPPELADGRSQPHHNRAKAR